MSEAALRGSETPRAASGGRWNQVKNDYPDEFRKYVDSILTEDSLTEYRDMIDALMPAENPPR